MKTTSNLFTTRRLRIREITDQDLGALFAVYGDRESMRWGQGFATEVGFGMIQYGSEKLGLNEIIATTATENKSSHNVLRKIGMVEIEPRIESDGTLTNVFAWRKK